MSVYDSSDAAFFLIDGYSILGATTEINIEAPLKVEDVTPLGAAAEVFASCGIVSAKMGQKGLFDDDSGSSHDALVSKNGSNRVICFGAQGNTAGKDFIGLSGAIQTKYDPEMKIGEHHKAIASYQGNGVKEDGKILHAHGAETGATGNTQASSVDNAASSANGGAGYLEVSALTLGGYTNVIVTLQDSADNVTFADIASGAFTAKTSAPAAQRLAISGTIRRYTASRWEYTGSGSGQSVTFMCGIVRS